MSTSRNRFAWLKSGLFWRTFFLLAFLIAASMAAWIVSFRVVERTPREKQMAAQVISIVTITRAALTHSAPDLRQELLFDLASNEGIRIYPLEETDEVEPSTDNTMTPLIQNTIKSSLGADTRFAAVVNGTAGFWVSFKIDDDDYWLMLDRERIDRTSVQWLGWVTVTLLLSLSGAVFITRLINLPLARLTAATRSIAGGQQPELLPEAGPTEIKEANRSFNQMVDDLNRIASDRAVVLAGISHDLRTPISRMLLEIEMANLSENSRLGMHTDLAQMDAIIGQFLDYARPSDNTDFAPVDLTNLLLDITREAARLPDVWIGTDLVENVAVLGHATELRRVFSNLIENARRYAKSEEAPISEIEISCHVNDGKVTIAIEDRGPGIPEAAMERLIKPFTRLDEARGQANGAGLGLAIVDRIVKRHSGTLRIENRVGGGLTIEIDLPVC